MMTYDIAFDIGKIRRLLLSSHLTMIAIMIIGAIVRMGHNQPMSSVIAMLMRP
jgi:hypothetical protein